MTQKTAATNFQTIENALYPLGGLAAGFSTMREYVLADGSVWTFRLHCTENGTEATVRVEAVITEKIHRQQGPEVSDEQIETRVVRSESNTVDNGSLNVSKVVAGGLGKSLIERWTEEMFGTAAFVTTDSDDAV